MEVDGKERGGWEQEGREGRRREEEDIEGRKRKRKRKKWKEKGEGMGEGGEDPSDQCPNILYLRHASPFPDMANGSYLFGHFVSDAVNNGGGILDAAGAIVGLT